MFDARLRDEDRVVHVYAVDTHIDAFLIDDNGKFRWISRNEFMPVPRDEDIHIIYECDRKDNCETCTYPECRHTTNIEHAVNFHKVLEGFYEENGRV